jgi:arylsulfatase B
MRTIDRRSILRAAGGVPASLALGQGPTFAAPPKRPNVVILITDDQGYGDLACHGNPVIKTPNLDALHGRSVRFTNFHASPTCAPTRSALMTGRFTNATGAWHTIMGRSLLRPGEVTMADCFRASGYRTGIFGKWHLGDNYPCRPQDRGFDEAMVCGGGGVWQAPDYFGNDYQDDTYERNGKPEAQKGFCTDVFFENAMRFMDGSQRKQEPFFCYLSTNAPHSPMWAPDSYANAYRGVKNLRDPGFYGMVTNIDDNLARLMKFMKERQLEENTIFVYMTDNGSSSGGQVFNAGMRGTKGSPYEGGHRVPFFVHWPAGGLKGGRDIDTLTAHVDVLPTFMDLCQLKRPDGPPLHGKSLRPLLGGKAAQWPDRALVTDSQRMENLVPWKHAAVMTQQWRLVSPTGEGDPAKLELFDIRQDPGQKQDVSAAHPQVVASLKAKYEAWWKDTSRRSEEFVRIVLGHEKANPVKLSSHDWHGGNGALSAWNQRQIREGPAVNGVWAVDVARAGDYRIELRRWPVEADVAINAACRDAQPNREDMQGKAISAVKARLKIGNVDVSQAVQAADKAATFRVSLPAGPAELQSWFFGQDGTERGAYFVYVERIKG